MAASVLAAACTDVLSLATSRPRADLAVLRLQSAAPAPATARFFVSNAQATTRNLTHPDAFGTLFLRVRFPAGFLATVSGRAATAADSVEVTIQPESGTYGFTLSASATFASANPVTATFFYASYGDFATSRAGSRYASANELAQALSIWREDLPDRFSEVTGSGPAGTDAVGGSVPSPGTYLVAAPK